jgi:hypothetical protein
MATKFDTFLTDNKIDPRRLLSASRQIERLRGDDRRIRLALSQARKSEVAKRPEGLSKPRSGRPVNPKTLRDASAGLKLSTAARTRLLRAVNRILEQKKCDAVALDALF